MAIETHISDADDGTHVHIHDYKEFDRLEDQDYHSLMVVDPVQVAGQFQTVNRTSAGTTTVVTPPKGGAIILTGFILGADKVNSATVTLRFNDDTRTADIYTGIVTDAPINLAHNFNSRTQGWRDARVELVTVGAVQAYLTLNYIKVKDSLAYDAWDERR